MGKPVIKDIQAIFFDFDGVILESVDVKGWAFGKLFEEHPQHVDEIVSFHHANGGLPRFDKFRYIYKNILQKPLPDQEFDGLCNEFSRLVFHRVVNCDFVPGALEFLQKYYQKIPFYIISGTPHDEMSRIVEAKGLGRYFQGVFGSPTPKGEWAKKLIEENNFDAKRIVFIGDAMSDYRAAQENGLFFVARVKDEQSDVFKERVVDLIVKDLRDLGNQLFGEKA